MSLNVQEFFEPCMDIVHSWEKSQKTNVSIHAFAEKHPGVLDQQFVTENAERRMSWIACKNMSDLQWDAGVSLVRSVIAESGADVIALQEFAVTRTDVVPPNYRIALVSSTGEPGWKDSRLGNAILVRSSWDVLSTEALNLEHGEAVPRSAACATLGTPAPICFRVKVCSVHLSGGRFDDARWETETAQLRTRQLQGLLESLRRSDNFQQHTSNTMKSSGRLQSIPLVLAGDFNAQLSPQAARKTLNRYSLFQDAVKAGRENSFLKYMTDGHEFLHRQGFRSAYYPAAARTDHTYASSAADAPVINFTSKFGAVVDFVYYPLQSMQLAQNKQVTVIDTVGRGVSDHQAIKVQFRVQSEECHTRPYYVSTNQKAVLQGIGMTVPSMFAMWFGYALQVRNTRESTVRSLGQEVDVPKIRSLLDLLRVFFWVHLPGRMIATYAVGVSTFVFWCAFSAAQSTSAFGGMQVMTSLVAAVVNAVLTTPIWALVVNMQMDTQKIPDTWDTTVGKIYSTRGLQGFCAGLLPNLLMIGFPVVQSNIYHALTLFVAAALHESDTAVLFQQWPFLAAALGAVATMVATTATYPVQVVRNRWQAGLPMTPEGSEALNFCALCRMLYLGYGVKMVHGAVTNALVFMFKEQFYAWSVQG